MTIKPPVTFADAIDAVRPNADAIIAEVTRKLLKKKSGGFFPNEVEAARHIVTGLVHGTWRQRFCLLAPPQFGKANTMKAVQFYLRALIPGLKFVFVCANDQLGLRVQNQNRLEPQIQVLSRSDRRLFDVNSNELWVIFFDESHCGDGIDMTMRAFLNRHDATLPHRLFICVSATPFSSLSSAEDVYWPSMDELEEADYNSVRVMLENNRIVAADPLFVRNDITGEWEIDVSANVYRHIKRIMDSGDPDGYGMIRLSRDQAEVLRRHLEDTYGERIYIKDWNMHSKGFSINEFVKEPRYDQFTLILVQQMARMGNTIDTSRFHFFYEHSASNLDTNIQSFAGRCSGWLKADHEAIVYSDPIKAEAYDLFLRAGSPLNMSKFHRFCEDHSIELSTRAVFQRKTVYKVRAFTLEFHGNTSIDYIKEQMRLEAKRRGLGDLRNIRTLSQHSVPSYKKNPAALYPTSKMLPYEVPRQPGSLVGFIYDRFKDNAMRKTWTGTLGRVYHRTDEVSREESSLQPTDESLFSELVPSN
jgi:hypothetical protein